MPRCQYCGAFYADHLAVRRHQGQAPTCRKGRDTFWSNLLAARPLSSTYEQTHQEDPAPDIEGGEDNLDSPPHHDDYGVENGAEETHLPAQDHRARVVDAIDKDWMGEVWREGFPAERQAGTPHGSGKTSFDAILDEQVLQGGEIWGPFANDDEWHLAKWLIKNVGHNQAEQFLKLNIIQQQACPSFRNKAGFLDAIDKLPSGAEWQCESVTLTGDVVDEHGAAELEEVELWFRDPVACIHELIGNPMFRDSMRYAPERQYTSEGGTNRVVNETWTGDWWWDSRLGVGATIAPVILSSDKTQLSRFRGDKAAWPVYLTIGNLLKELRRSASAHGTILLGYLPIPHLDGFTEKIKSFVKYRLFHYCMTKILTSFATAGIEGTLMTCADSMVRRVYPILAAYVADYPEQCLVACCMENCCPLCKVEPTARGEHTPADPRDVAETINILAQHDNANGHAGAKEAFRVLGLRPVYPPFWATLPHCDIFKAFTPDLLHQLHKGAFKDHLVKWCMSIIGEDEIDARFKSMTSHQGLRHFKNGISGVSQWTGKEHKEMEKVFVGLVASGQDHRLVAAVRALVDFIYYSSLHSHTTQSLEALRDALDRFHDHKAVFIELGGRQLPHFNIPKIHVMEHYVDLIQRFGSADGFNTESPERLHIDYAKDAYRASNKKDYVVQMTVWLRRQEAVDRYTMYLEWCRKEREGGSDKGSVEDPQLEVDETRPEEMLGTGVGEERVEEEAGGTEDGTLVVSVVTRSGGSAASTTHSSLCEVPTYHPPHLRHIPASKIIAGQHSTRFLESVQAYLASLNIAFTPRSFDTFNLYSRLVFRLPKILEVSNCYDHYLPLSFFLVSVSPRVLP